MADKLDSFRGISRAGVSRDILVNLAIGGVIVLGLANPALLTPAILLARLKWKEKPELKKFKPSFYYLRHAGFINVEERKGSLFISLTEKGKRKGEILKIFQQLQNLKKHKHKQKWDRRWYIFIFDVASSEKVKRDALRMFIKKLGLIQLQKSVWITPYDIRKEIKFLRDFFKLTHQQCRVVVSSDIGEDAEQRKRFGLT